jgi:SAD/SRA domain
MDSTAAANPVALSLSALYEGLNPALRKTDTPPKNNPPPVEEDRHSSHSSSSGTSEGYQILEIPNEPLDPGIMYVSTRKGFRPRFDPAQNRPPWGTRPPFGDLPGLYVGKTWHTRLGAAWDGTHPSSMGGIAVRAGDVGVVSVALSGLYEDDIDEGYRFIYTGAGSNSFRRGQTTDQDWTRKNLALRENVNRMYPVRVIRGFGGNNRWSPPQGYIYSGLYEVVAAWDEIGMGLSWYIADCRQIRI